MSRAFRGVVPRGSCRPRRAARLHFMIPGPGAELGEMVSRREIGDTNHHDQFFFGDILDSSDSRAIARARHVDLKWARDYCCGRFIRDGCSDAGSGIAPQWMYGLVLGGLLHRSRDDFLGDVMHTRTSLEERWRAIQVSVDAGHWADAEARLRRWLEEENPEDGEHWSMLWGGMLYDQGRNPEALTVLSQVRKGDQAWAHAQTLIGEIAIRRARCRRGGASLPGGLGRRSKGGRAPPPARLSLHPRAKALRGPLRVSHYSTSPGTHTTWPTSCYCSGARRTRRARDRAVPPEGPREFLAEPVIGPLCCPRPTDRGLAPPRGRCPGLRERPVRPLRPGRVPDVARLF